MMHARGLVRLLLRLRRNRATLGDPLLNEAQSLGTYPQSGGHSEFGSSFLSLVGQCGQAQNEAAIGGQSDFGDNISQNDWHVNGLGDQHGLAVDLNRLAGQSGALSQFVGVGQQASSLNQQIGTASGFWVPFKHRS